MNNNTHYSAFFAELPPLEIIMLESARILEALFAENAQCGGLSELRYQEYLLVLADALYDEGQEEKSQLARRRANLCNPGSSNE